MRRTLAILLMLAAPPLVVVANLFAPNIPELFLYPPLFAAFLAPPYFLSAIVWPQMERDEALKSGFIAAVAAIAGLITFGILFGSVEELDDRDWAIVAIVALLVYAIGATVVIRRPEALRIAWPAVCVGTVVTMMLTTAILWAAA